MLSPGLVCVHTSATRKGGPAAVTSDRRLQGGPAAPNPRLLGLSLPGEGLLLPAGSCHRSPGGNGVSGLLRQGGRKPHLAAQLPEAGGGPRPRECCTALPHREGKPAMLLLLLSLPPSRGTS